jgi:hypothetical protein
MSIGKMENINPLNRIENALTQEQSLNIDEVFKENPEISILFKNNKELYQEYLNSIFPESKIQDIVFRGQEEKESVSKNLTQGELNTGIYLTKIKNHAKFYSQAQTESGKGNVIAVLINTNNPKYETDDALHSIKIKPKDVDAILSPYKFNPEIVVFSPDQIHILGSNQDIEQAKEWLKNKEI